MSDKILRNHTPDEQKVTFGGTEFAFPSGDTTVPADLADFAQHQKGFARDPETGTLRACLQIVHPKAEVRDALADARAEGDLAARAELTPLLQAAKDRIGALEAELKARPVVPPPADADPSALETAATKPVADPAPEPK